jgi:hypothetical protein
MSGQPEARPLQWGPRGENSLIKFCLASPRLGPLHPHANNLETLAMAKLGHLCATSASQKTSATIYNCRQSTQIYRSDLSYRIFHFCAKLKASRIFPILQKNTRIQPELHCFEVPSFAKKMCESTSLSLLHLHLNCAQKNLYILVNISLFFNKF